MLNTKTNKERGFVILIAVLLSSIFVLIGSSIFNIAIKELILTSGGRESQFSFYAADAGMECAMYWDFKGSSVYATSSYSTSQPTGLVCAGQDITANDVWEWKVPSETTETKSQTVFGFDIFPDDSTRSDCVRVSVTKDNGTTVIESRGYNTCDITNERRVERGFRATY